MKNNTFASFFEAKGKKQYDVVVEKKGINEGNYFFVQL